MYFHSKSLPASLDDAVVITENNLGAQLDRLRRGANAASSHVGVFHYDSGDSSMDDLASGGETSSSECLLDENVSHPHSQHKDQSHPQLHSTHVDVSLLFVNHCVCSCICMSCSYLYAVLFFVSLVVCVSC